MNTQIDTKSKLTCSFFTLAIYTPVSQTGFSPKEMGYEIDEDELASEMLAAQAACMQDQPAPEIAADEFESTYKWFIS